MRCIFREVDIDHAEDNEENYDECYDAEFARICRKSLATTDTTLRFSRIKKSNKFKIETGNGQEARKTKENYDKADNCRVTYLDSVIGRLEDANVKEAEIMKLMNYLKDQHFDTESMDLDVADGKLDGNISIFMQNEKRCLQSLLSSLKESKGMLTSSVTLSLPV